MIRSLTLIENKTEEGEVEYSLNGSLPIEEAAKALVIIAFNAGQPKKDEAAVK